MSSIGSNQSSKRWELLSIAECESSGLLVTFFMAWSPGRRFNAGDSRLITTETTPPSIPTNPATGPCKWPSRARIPGGYPAAPEPCRSGHQSWLRAGLWVRDWTAGPAATGTRRLAGPRREAQDELGSGERVAPGPRAHQRARYVLRCARPSRPRPSKATILG